MIKKAILTLAALLSAFSAMAQQPAASPFKGMQAAELQTAFIDACKAADLQKLKDILEVSPGLASLTKVEKIEKAWDAQGKPTHWITPTYTPLLYLIEESRPTPERIECMQLLVAKGARTNASTFREGTATAWTTVSLVHQLTPEELEFLISKGANPNFKFSNTGETPIWRTAFGLTNMKNSKSIEKAIAIIKVLKAHHVNMTDRPLPKKQTAQQLLESTDNPELATLLK